MYSRQFIDILKEYTDQIQQASIDEAYMDVSDLIRDRGEALRLAAAIKDSVRDRLGFTVNIGVSVNKFLAKMASDFEKPDKVHTLYPEEIRGKMWPMDVRDLYGCGAATAQQLHGLGLKTIGEVAVCDENLLKSILGEKRGEYLHRRANGIDLSPIEKVRQEAKSYSNETTTAADIDRNNYEADAIPIIRKLSLKVAERLRKDDVFGATCFVQVKTGGFQRHSRQTRMKQSSNDGNMIFETANRRLFHDGPDNLLITGKEYLKQLSIKTILPVTKLCIESVIIIHNLHVEGKRIQLDTAHSFTRCISRCRNR
jgi:DNA polymerase-4